MLIRESDLRTPFILVRTVSNESFEEIKVESFDHLLDELKKSIPVMVPVDLLKSFERSGVKWNTPRGRNRPVVWPDEVIDTKLGCCLDFAIFSHLVFEHFGIPNALGYSVFAPHDLSLRFEGHAYTLFKINGFVFVWNYFGTEWIPSLGSTVYHWDINGPFKSYAEANKYLCPYFSVLFHSLTKQYSMRLPVTDSYEIYLEKNQLRFIDDAFNSNAKIDQETLFSRSKDMMQFFGAIGRDRMRRHGIHESVDTSNIITCGNNKPSKEGISAFMKLVKEKSVKGGNSFEVFERCLGKSKRTLLGRE